jgi:acyl-CoA synthetase (AMP-forming)/AMP-acid ligase II
MFAPNCIDYALVFHACALSGVIVSPVAPNFQVAELKQQLQVLIITAPYLFGGRSSHCAAAG